MGTRVMRCGWALALSVVVIACGDDEPPSDPCANGICPDVDAGGSGGTSGAGAMGGTGGGGTGGSGGSSGTSGAGATGGSGAIGGSGATGGSGGSSGSGGTGGACAESWTCSPWTTNGQSDNGTRTCVDANACGTTAMRPIESATLPALDFNYYQCNVEPIFDKGCAHLGCHGTEQGRALRVYARGRLRITGDQLSTANICLAPGNSPPKPSEDCTGSIECACWMRPHTANEWRANFDAARGFGLDASASPLGNVDASELLTQPLVGGGLAHAGIKMWRANDPDYLAVQAWLSGQTLAMCTGPQAQN